MLDEKVILSIGNRRQEFDIKSFFNSLDKKINSNNYKNNYKDDKYNIKIISNDGKEKIYFASYTQDLGSNILDNNKSVLNLNQDFLTDLSEKNTSIVDFVDDTKNKQENEIDNLIAERILKNSLLTDLVNNPETVKNKKSKSKQKVKINLEEENKFEEGLKAKLKLLAQEKLNDFALTPEEKINKSNDYYAKVLYPLFAYLEESLSTYNRKANVNINTFMISLNVRYKEKIEYKYQVKIVNPDSYPVLQIMVSDLSSKLITRHNLNNTSIDKVTREDIFQDFLISYKSHIEQAINTSIRFKSD